MLSSRFPFDRVLFFLCSTICNWMSKSFISLLVFPSSVFRFPPKLCKCDYASVKEVVSVRHGCLEGEKSLTNIVNNDMISDDEVVASDVPRDTCFFLFSQAFISFASFLTLISALGLASSSPSKNKQTHQQS